MYDEVVYYYKTQYRKQRWLEMLYRKDGPFGRVLLFLARRKMILRLRYHAACRVVKKIVSYCIHVGAVGNDERYIVRLGRYEK